MQNKSQNQAHDRVEKEKKVETRVHWTARKIFVEEVEMVTGPKRE